MKKVIVSLLIFLFSLFSFQSAQAQVEEGQLFEQPKEEFLSAIVVEITQEGAQEIEGTQYPYQIVKVKFLDGSEKGNENVLEHGKRFSLTDAQKVKAGEKVVIVKSTISEESEFQIIDKYRLDKILILTLTFFVVVLALARFKGLGSIAGMIISLFVIIKFIVPQILLGRDPVLVSIAGAFVIMVVTIYLAHGFSKKTSVAVVSTLITLVIAGVISLILVNLSNLTGSGSEEAYSLRFGQTGGIKLKGLLLGGMIIGALGVLDDITTSLSAAIFEISKNEKTRKFKQLVKSGFNIGTEHISSLVNTLVLAYAGASLPIFIFLVFNPTGQPTWFIVNSEFISEEIVRTLAGSFALVFAVPITTILAAWTFSKRK